MPLPDNWSESLFLSRFDPVKVEGLMNREAALTDWFRALVQAASGVLDYLQLGSPTPGFDIADLKAALAEMEPPAGEALFERLLTAARDRVAEDEI